MDHWFQMESFATAQDPMLEGYTSLGFPAGQTQKIRLSLLVTGVTYRHPGLVAKIVTTLDILSGGRAGLGLGAAWYEREHLGLGVPFPPVSERFERLEEALQICHQMWSDDDGPFEGKYYQLAETICSPRPIQQPAPKILIGGSGERKTPKLVARYADACNLFAADPAEVAHSSTCWPVTATPKGATGPPSPPPSSVSATRSTMSTPSSPAWSTPSSALLSSR
jgi:F420-dependent oxidoreductase-like protein